MPTPLLNLAVAIAGVNLSNRFELYSKRASQLYSTKLDVHKGLWFPRIEAPRQTKISFKNCAVNVIKFNTLCDKRPCPLDGNPPLHKVDIGLDLDARSKIVPSQTSHDQENRLRMSAFFQTNFSLTFSLYRKPFRAH
jgi:hypothetical protein